MSQDIADRRTYGAQVRSAVDLLHLEDVECSVRSCHLVVVVVLGDYRQAEVDRGRGDQRVDELDRPLDTGGSTVDHEPSPRPHDRLTDRHRFRRPGQGERVPPAGPRGGIDRADGTVVVHSDEPGYRAVTRLSSALSELVGTYVHVITDDVPGADNAREL